ncbi:MAG: pyruvate kinase [Proteobacteria bacterium]|nr:MAG: pyruvate kinase [Pseudomonadota bacterium]
MRLTKIVATIGPACDAPETLEAMIRAGVNVARVNLSHGTHAEHAARIARVRAAAERCGVPVAIMIDTKGPEVRTAPLAEEPVVLFAGDPFTLTVDGSPATRSGTSVTHAGLPKEVPVGATILIDDGQIELRAVAARPGALVCEVVCGGELGGRKSVHVQGARLSLEALSDADRADLAFAARQDADWIAASFVRTADDVVNIRDTIRRHRGEIPILAKIEDPDAVANLDAILAVSDGAMVARGDLGVLLPVGEVPLVQKRVIRETVSRGKPVVTATQMLDSMERNPRPTRAEASDVANAIFDGTSAVMLSGETAGGRHPVASVRTMVELARQAEPALGDYGDLQRIEMPHSENVTEAVAESAVALARELHAAAIVSLTETGSTSRFVSKYRPPCPILAITASPKVQRRLTLSWGVTPLLHPPGPDDERVRFAIAWASKHGVTRIGDALVVTAGVAGAPGSTNLIRVVLVE